METIDRSSIPIELIERILQDAFTAVELTNLLTEIGLGRLRSNINNHRPGVVVANIAAKQIASEFLYDTQLAEAVLNKLEEKLHTELQYFITLFDGKAENLPEHLTRNLTTKQSLAIVLLILFHKSRSLTMFDVDKAWQILRQNTAQKLLSFTNVTDDFELMENTLEQENEMLRGRLVDLEERLTATEAAKSGNPIMLLDNLTVKLRLLEERLNRRFTADESWRSQVISVLMAQADQIKNLSEEVSTSSDYRIIRTDKRARVAVFVDVQNMYYSAKRYGGKLDFTKLLQFIVSERRLVKAIAYIVQSPEVDQSSFVGLLEAIGYTVKRKQLKTRNDGSAKGDWDMEIALDVISMLDKLDVVAIVSGDGDFVPLISLIKAKGPLVEVYSFLATSSEELVQQSDFHKPLDRHFLITDYPYDPLNR